MERVLIVGGGIAGLTAAMELADSFEVVVIEARDRLGGRIQTMRGKSGAICELGAEFIHGSPPLLRKLIAEAKLPLHKAPDRHWRFDGKRLCELRDFWAELAEVTEQMDPARYDQSFAEFLRSATAPASSKALAVQFVEGFHAADANEASVHALHATEKSSEELSTDQFRIEEGYGALVDHCVTVCRQKGVRFHLRTEVRRVSWSRGEVTLTCNCESPEFVGTRFISTAPIGVLQSGALNFNPVIPEKDVALSRFRMGAAYKIILEFRERLWMEKNFGFVHVDDPSFFTWWADQRSDVLVGWSGGPKAETLSEKPPEVIETEAIDSLSRVFSRSTAEIRDVLIAAHHHNWRHDPYARGAYSYLPVGAADAPFELAKPVADTIYFAGEATDFSYQLGTVHAAIASGHRVAREIRAAARHAK